MIIRSICLGLVVFAFQACEKSESDNVDKLSSTRGLQNYYIDNFRCGVFVPQNYDPHKKYPLLVILHGYSDTTSWDRNWYHEPIVTEDPCIVLTPKCPITEQEGWGNSWLSEISPMMQKTFEMMSLAKKAFNLDTSRFYIGGTSMGAIGIYGVLEKKPGLFTAAYLECGAGDVKIAPLLTKTPLWIFHGDMDYTVPVYNDRMMYQSVLQNDGKCIRYTEYKGVGHNVWDYTKNETTLTSWLLAQKKGESYGLPDTVNTFSVNRIGKMWVKIDWTSQIQADKKDKNIWYYKIYRNGSLLSEPDKTNYSFTDTTAESTTFWSYQISTVNYYFQESLPTKAQFIKINNE
jgi:predicted esterase